MKPPAAVLDALRRARSVLLASHSPMDGDGVGCGLALQRVLRAQGKSCSFVTEAPVAHRYRFLPGVEEILLLGPQDAVPAADLLIGLDAGEADRLGRAWSERAPTTVVVNIDHHLSNPGYGDAAWVDAQAAATGELVFGLLRALDWTVDATAAHALLVSLVTDTGRFCYSSTTARTLEIAAELVRLGAQPDGLQRHLYGARPLREWRLRARALDRLRFATDGALAVLTIPHDFGADLGVDPEEVRDLVDVAIGVEGVLVGALVRGLPEGGCKVSLRSKDDRANVAAFAQSQGGGGHVRAAGFSSPDDPQTTAERIEPDLERLAVAASR